jgi:hypothetical protein
MERSRSKGEDEGDGMEDDSRKFHPGIQPPGMRERRIAACPAADLQRSVSITNLSYAADCRIVDNLKIATLSRPRRIAARPLRGEATSGKNRAAQPSSRRNKTRYSVPGPGNAWGALPA